MYWVYPVFSHRSTSALNSCLRMVNQTTNKTWLIEEAFGGSEQEQRNKER